MSKKRPRNTNICEDDEAIVNVKLASRYLNGQHSQQNEDSTNDFKENSEYEEDKSTAAEIRGHVDLKQVMLLLG